MFLSLAALRAVTARIVAVAVVVVVEAAAEAVVVVVEVVEAAADVVVVEVVEAAAEAVVVEVVEAAADIVVVGKRYCRLHLEKKCQQAGEAITICPCRKLWHGCDSFLSKL